MVAHHIDIVGVVGSSPASPTIKEKEVLDCKLSERLRKVPPEVWGNFNFARIQKEKFQNSLI